MFDVEKIRQDFPALSKLYNGQQAVFLDGPGGTQIPNAVIQAISEFMQQGVANLGGFYPTSIATTKQLLLARQAVKALINAEYEDEISFGQNMTSITFALSRAIMNTWQPGDEIIVTELDHDANISPWVIGAKERGACVKMLPFDTYTYQLDLDVLEQYLHTGKVRFMALTMASNICGSITNISSVMDLAKKYDVRVFIDAVHFIAHHKVDVQALECDWLVCSAYKFCGPHIGILYAKKATMAHIKPYKIRPAPDAFPYCLETGTQNFEAVAGLYAAILHKASLVTAKKTTLAQSLKQSIKVIQTHETTLKKTFITALKEIPEIKIHGIDQINQLDNRTPTFALEFLEMDSAQVAKALASKGVFIGHGHFYVPEFVQKLKLMPKNGVVRVGFAYYNTVQEIHWLISCFQQLIAKQTDICV
ncbi:cysteine desulfurase-like protein [Facilibium subflavum]|uniref:cysteine desulfurase-like protein n=1 Tax=Facilibium subflavum TaxID=2219058 RepID=UPI000E64A449|nr:cysteine desulfurase-like protein [Facilibium subflavum]